MEYRLFKLNTCGELCIRSIKNKERGEVFYYEISMVEEYVGGGSNGGDDELGAKAEGRQKRGARPANTQLTLAPAEHNNTFNDHTPIYPSHIQSGTYMHKYLILTLPYKNQ